MSEFRKQRQEDLFEFKASLVSTASFRIKEGREGKGKKNIWGLVGVYCYGTHMKVIGQLVAVTSLSTT